MEEELYQKAIHFLSFRPRSEKEVREYLKKKEKTAPDAVISRVTEKLISQKFINDVSFAELYVRSKTHHKPKARKFIEFELKEKGISKELIDNAFLAEGGEVPTDQDSARVILQKQRGKYEGLSKQQRLQKAGSMLARKGFSIDVVRRAIDEVFQT